MSKIVQAINSMIANAGLLANVVEGHNTRNGEEYFFCYKEKYIWSIYLREDGDYWVYYYPEAMSSAQAASIQDFSTYPTVAYGDNDLRSREARESVAELFMILKGKLYDIDAVLDDIINDDLIG
ncbi:hypothetical protein [Ectopseudomonas mendocina]|uniref:hypothetical protein n=1 Tax=Ectopseudomonas mendocina TaxID=300 RepID=UPI000694FC1E|nr:hypothetical protein [Pseudomonas mendocina]